MPLLTGMKGDGFYDRHSSVQRETFESVSGWIGEAVGRMALPDEPAPIAVVDYGCSQGRNSIVAVGLVVDALRRRRPAQPIVAVHSDLPSNDFNRLFAALHDPAATNYLQAGGRRWSDVFALAAAGSFYGPLLPPRSVHFAMSFLALEWLDRLPDVPVPEFVGYMGGSAAAKEAFRQQAVRDLARFFGLRAVEMATGGQLWIVIPGRDGGRSCSDGLYDVLNDACADLVAAGRLAREQYERLVMPVYFRSLDELVAPIDRPDSAVRGAFRVERAEVLDVPTSFVQRYVATGDADAYADDFAAFLRASSEPVVSAALAGPGGDASIVPAVYDRVRERLAAEPVRYLFHNIEVAVLLTRT